MLRLQITPFWFISNQPNKLLLPPQIVTFNSKNVIYLLKKIPEMINYKNHFFISNDWSINSFQLYEHYKDLITETEHWLKFSRECSCFWKLLKDFEKELLHIQVVICLGHRNVQERGGTLLLLWPLLTPLCLIL